MNKFIGFLFLIILLIIQIQVQTSCANIIPPTGGPRDSLPPVLVNAVPKDSTTSFHSKTIVLTFDEYVHLSDKVNEEFIVSPNPESLPFPENKLRTVTIKLKDSLKPNTTYSLDFGNSIQDVNENNPVKNFVYVFSTGSSIDVGTISGNVTLAETGVADSTLIVVLHENLNDSAVKKLRPDYYTRLDSSGNFRFRFLPHKTFNIYVLPNDYTKRYDDSTKMFAFYNSAVNVDSNNERVKLYAYQQEKPQDKNTATQTAAPPSKKGEKEEDKRLKVSTGLESSKQDILSDLELTFNRNVKQFDSSKVVLSDTNFQAVSGFTIRRDTSLTKFFIHYNWLENESFKLVLQKEAFADSAGNTLGKNDTISFSTKRESDYGSVRLHFNGLDLAKNPVLQLVQNDKVTKSVPLASIEWYEKLFQPGDYELRILFDDNKNGIWDPGNFDEKKQPETVQRIPRKLTIKPNWDNEVDINL